MNKVVSRLLTFFIGIPLILTIVFVNFQNHLPMNIAVTLFSVLAANEFYNMLGKDNKLYPRPLILIFTGLLPLLSYIFIITDLGYQITLWIFIIEVIILLGLEGLFSKTFENSIKKISLSLLIIFYCGQMFTFVSRMTQFQNASYYISLFFIFVFLCDSAAWFFGVLFGKNNRGFIAVSPNKSIVGFIGGIIGSVASGLVFKLIVGDAIVCTYTDIVILGLGTSLAAIVGDLIESVFKRSTGVKDSGNLIPGRGGVLDSIDSILLAAPVFYIGMHFVLLR